MSAEELLQKQIIEKAWSDAAFKQQLLENPKAAIQEAFGVAIPDEIKLTVVEETPTSFYLVLPPAPEASKQDGEQPVTMW